MLRRHPGEGREGRIVLRRPCQGFTGLAFEQGQALGRRAAAVDPAHAARLPIDDVVAMPAPGVELARAVSRRGVEQPGRGGEALRPGLDALPAGFGDGVRHAGATPAVFKASAGSAGAARPASASISEAVALADPTTPGTPAPGWVPAPVK